MRDLASRSLEWLGAGWVLALLWVRTLVRFYARVAKSNFPFAGLRAVAAGVAAVCGSALPELVSASDTEAGKLERPEYTRAVSASGMLIATWF